MEMDTYRLPEICCRWHPPGCRPHAQALCQEALQAWRLEVAAQTDTSPQRKPTQPEPEEDGQLRPLPHRALPPCGAPLLVEEAPPQGAEPLLLVPLAGRRGAEPWWRPGQREARASHRGGAPLPA